MKDSMPDSNRLISPPTQPQSPSDTHHHLRTQNYQHHHHIHHTSPSPTKHHHSEYHYKQSSPNHLYNPQTQYSDKQVHQFYKPTVTQKHPIHDHLQSPKDRKIAFGDKQHKPHFKPFVNRNRKYSENDAIYENQEAEKQCKHDEKLSTEENKGSPQKKRQAQLQPIKNYINQVAVQFFRRKRKHSETSSPLPDGHQPEMLIKRKSLKWEENNSFQFDCPSNSSNKSQSEQNSVFIDLPLLTNMRKNSENLQPVKKKVPSFLTSQKFHRNSLTNLQQPSEHKIDISSFIIIKQLGKGAFGKVVMAIEKSSNMICAIKIICKRQIRENNMEGQLARELKIQLYVNHPNIVKIYGFFEDLLHCYIIMECALDGHLSEYLSKSNSPLPELEAAKYLNQICSAVSLLHSEHIIHRDLKPQNVLLHEGIVKLCDFGWSVYHDSKLRTTFCGTPVYLCPEILVGDEYDQTVDIWTIGIILYFMFYKTNPFNIKVQEELVNILNDPINFHQDVTISPEAKDFIQACLSKRAVDRPNIRQLLLHPFLLTLDNTKEPKF